MHEPTATAMSPSAKKPSCDYVCNADSTKKQHYKEYNTKLAIRTTGLHNAHIHIGNWMYANTYTDNGTRMTFQTTGGLPRALKILFNNLNKEI